MGTIFVDNIKHQSSQGSGTITLGASGETLALASGASVTGNGLVGITMADHWRLSAFITNPSGVITSNLERVDDATFGSIGTGMTESSGVFTFPQTGIYLIMVQVGIDFPNVADNQCNVYTQVSSDSGSNFDDTGRAVAGSNSSSGNSFFTVFSQSFVDVTNASTFRVRFNATSFVGGSTLSGATDDTVTSFNFIRLGDT